MSLERLTTDELLNPKKIENFGNSEIWAEIRRRLERLAKCEAVLLTLKPMIGWLGASGRAYKEDDPLVCEYCGGTDVDNLKEEVKHLAGCPVLLLLAALEDR